MKCRLCILSFAVAGLCIAVPSAAVAGPPVNVTQHHNNPSRDGLYIDPAFTTAAAANLARDLSFDGTISGQVYAQPLYVENGPGGAAMVIAVTELNNVYALNASTGAIIWQRNLGTPSSAMGNISPSVGITGTPVVDQASRSLFLDAVVSGPNNLIFSLNVDTGATNSGWPVNVNTRISGFSSGNQSQRAALGLLGSVVYVPYGGYWGDAPPYFGRVLGVQISNPAATIGSFATTSTRSGIWGPGGIASDGTDIFVTTGNGPGGVTWNGSEAVIRLQPGPSFSNSTVDYFAPTNWASLDTMDDDLGGSGPVLVDVPGATPSALVVQYGKDAKVYLLNRNNLGGVTTPVTSISIGGSGIQAAAAYRTAVGTYVVFRPTTGTLTALRITATNPPTLVSAWSVSSSGRGSPFVTSTDGTNNVIVWAVGSSGDQRLHGHNGDTGAVVYTGGGANEVMTGTRGYNTAAIAARGRIYVANDNKVFAFGVPTGPTPTPGPTASPTATPTASPTPTATPVITPTATPIATPSPTPITTPTATPIATPTPTPGITPTATPIATPSPTPGLTPTATPIVTPTGTPGTTPTPTPGGTATPTPGGTATPSPSPAAQALNLSTRMQVQTGANVGIGGFIITGSAPMHLLLRAIGPSLAPGVPDALADTVLELHGPSGFATITNDNWRDDPDQEAAIIATGIPPDNDLESAIDVTLNPGAYTSIVRGKNNTSGVGLVEMYNLSQAVPAKLANISTRAFVGTDADVVIAGFILGNHNGGDRIAVRGLGPSLTGQGVPDALPNPTLELHNGSGTLLASNDNWQDDSASAAQLTAVGLAPTSNLESGIVSTLPPGLYTALLSGVGSATGVGLVEVYDLAVP